MPGRISVNSGGAPFDVVVQETTSSPPRQIVAAFGRGSKSNVLKSNLTTFRLRDFSLSRILNINDSLLKFSILRLYEAFLNFILTSQ